MLEPCLFIYFLKFILAMPRGMWDLSSLIREQTQAPWFGSTESYPLGCQGSPSVSFFNEVIFHPGMALTFVPTRLAAWLSRVLCRGRKPEGWAWCVWRGAHRRENQRLNQAPLVAGPSTELGFIKELAGLAGLKVHGECTKILSLVWTVTANPQWSLLI